MVMEVVGLSNQGQDAVLEIQRVGLFLGLAPGVWRRKALHSGMRTGCESDAAGFLGMKGKILRRLADGECVCLFKYERVL